MYRPLNIFFCALLVVSVSSCRFVSSIIHDDDVVAKVGKHKLYRVEVESVIPAGTPSEDSLALAKQYIRSWAADFVFDDAAAASLSKKDLDLSEQLEQYRRSLVKYRYEQMFVSERLDTIVSPIDVQAYYDENQERFTLSYPIVKARFVRMSPDSPSFAEVRKLIASSADEDLAALEDLVVSVAEKYSDFGGSWLDITELADEFGVDYGTLLALMSNSVIRYVSDDGLVEYAYIADYMRAGSIPPVEYCESRIKESIIASRRQALAEQLERDLLDDARARGIYEIY